MKLEVWIEHCSDCAKHKYCTWHNEEAYLMCFTAISAAIRQNFPEVKIHRSSNPRIGAFEVLIAVSQDHGKSGERSSSKKKNGHGNGLGGKGEPADNQNKLRLYSKLKSGRWPSMERIVNLIHFAMEHLRECEKQCSTNVKPKKKPKSAPVTPRSQQQGYSFGKSGSTLKKVHSAGQLKAGGVFNATSGKGGGSRSDTDIAAISVNGSPTQKPKSARVEYDSSGRRIIPGQVSPTSESAKPMIIGVVINEDGSTTEAVAHPEESPPTTASKPNQSAKSGNQGKQPTKPTTGKAPQGRPQQQGRGISGAGKEAGSDTAPNTNASITVIGTGGGAAGLVVAPPPQPTKAPSKDPPTEQQSSDEDVPEDMSVPHSYSGKGSPTRKKLKTRHYVTLAHQEEVITAAMVDNCVVTLDFDGNFRWWEDLDKPNELRYYESGKSALCDALAVMAFGSKFVCIGLPVNCGTIIFWERLTGKIVEQKTLEQHMEHGETMTAFYASKSQCEVYVGTSEGRVMIFGVIKGLATADINDINLKCDGECIMHKDIVKIPGIGDLVNFVSVHNDYLIALAETVSNRFAHVAEGSLTVWQKSKRKQKKKDEKPWKFFQTHALAEVAKTVVFNENNLLLGMQGDNRATCIVQYDFGESAVKELKRWPPIWPFPVEKMAWDPQGLLAVSGRDCLVHVFDTTVPSAPEVWRSRKGEDWCSILEWHPHGLLIGWYSQTDVEFHYFKGIGPNADYSKKAKHDETNFVDKYTTVKAQRNAKSVRSDQVQWCNNADSEDDDEDEKTYQDDFHTES